jgi:hypothetical protein
MTSGDASQEGMRRRPNPVDHDPLPLEEELAERLLAGTLHPTDVPPAFAGLAAVLTAVSAPPRPSELAGEEAARALFRTAVRPRGARGAGVRTARIRWLRAAIVLLLALLMIMGAALATGAVPAPSWPFRIPGAVHFHSPPGATTPKRERPDPTTGPAATTCQFSCQRATTGNKHGGKQGGKHGNKHGGKQGGKHGNKHGNKHGGKHAG